jgi:hypothetical protein
VRPPSSSRTFQYAVFALKLAMLTPASRAALKAFICSSVQYSEWPEITTVSWSWSDCGAVATCPSSV